MIRRVLPPLMGVDRDHQLRVGVSVRELLARDWRLARRKRLAVVVWSTPNGLTSTVREVA